MRLSLALALAGYFYWGVPKSGADDGADVRNVAPMDSMALTAANLMDRRSPLDNNFMRLGRSGALSRIAPNDDHHNYMRFGRTPERERRGGDNSNGFIRFGRPAAMDEDYPRFARQDQASNFMRFGRLPQNQFVRLGRLSEPNNFVRFGRAGSDPKNFVRFGRLEVAGNDADDGGFGRFIRPEASNYVRLGRSVTGPAVVQDDDDAGSGNAESAEAADSAKLAVGA